MATCSIFETDLRVLCLTQKAQFVFFSFDCVHVTWMVAMKNKTEVKVKGLTANTHTPTDTPKASYILSWHGADPLLTHYSGQGKPLTSYIYYTLYKLHLTFLEN